MHYMLKIFLEEKMYVDFVSFVKLYDWHVIKRGL